MPIFFSEMLLFFFKQGRIVYNIFHNLKYLDVLWWQYHRCIAICCGISWAKIISVPKKNTGINGITSVFPDLSAISDFK